MFPFRKYAKHQHKVAILVVGSEGIVVGSAVFILDADRQIPRPHENIGYSVFTHAAQHITFAE